MVVFCCEFEVEPGSNVWLPLSAPRGQTQRSRVGLGSVFFHCHIALILDRPSDCSFECASKALSDTSLSHLRLIYSRCVSEPVHRGALSDGVRHHFDRKGMVVVSGQSISTDRALELAIESGAEDVRETVDEEDQRLLQVSYEK